MGRTNPTLLSFRIGKNLRDSFSEICRSNNIPVSEAIRTFIVHYIECGGVLTFDFDWVLGCKEPEVGDDYKDKFHIIIDRPTKEEFKEMCGRAGSSIIRGYMAYCVKLGRIPKL